MFRALPSAENFLGIEPRYSGFERSRIVIHPVPYERTVSYGGGTERGPGALLEASHYIEFYDEETGREIHSELGIATLPHLAVAKKRDEDALEVLYEKTRELIRQEKFVVTIGGEHTITQAPVAAFAEVYRDLSVLQIDAHSDLRQEYEGNKFSHASVMARVCEFLDPRRLVQVGIRAQCVEEARMIQQLGITTLYAHQIRSHRYETFLRTWQDYAVERLTEHVYVTFDVDGLDPSIMPSTGTPEPDGLFWHETMVLLRKLGRRKTVVGCDVVELAPAKGVTHPDLAAARLVSKMLNYFVAKPPEG